MFYLFLVKNDPKLVLFITLLLHNSKKKLYLCSNRIRHASHQEQRNR